MDENKLLISDLSDSQIFDVNTNTIKKFDEFDKGVFNSDGSLIATASSYRANGMQIFDTKTGRRRDWLVGHLGIIKSLAHNSDGSRFAAGSADRIVRIWDGRTKKLLFELEGHSDTVESVTFNDDGKSLTSQSEKEIIIWNTENGAKIKEIKRQKRFDNDQRQAISSSGKFALVKEDEKPFRLVDAGTKETIREFVLIDQLDNLVFCPDEKHFLAKPWWSGWHLWDIKSGKPIREFNIGYSFYNRVAFHPDGRTFITGGEGQNIFMFDLEGGEAIWSLFPIDHEDFDLKKASEARRIASINRAEEMARLADIQNEAYKNKVYITFEHYGDMTDPGEQRLVESAEPKKSKVKKSAEESNAVWLRLHNDSPLPIQIPTQSMYLPQKDCFFEFATGEKISGLCNDREISIRNGLEDKDGKQIPYGFDFGSSAILLPQISVRFAVPREILKNGNAISFGFTFQKPTGANNPENYDYGTAIVLKFRGSDLPNK